MLRGASHPSPQTQQPQTLVQALETLGGLHPPDRGERLRQTLQHLRSLPGATSRSERLTGSSGGEGGAAQLLHLAQRTTWSSSAILRRPTAMVSATHTKRLRNGPQTQKAGHGRACTGG